MNEINKTKDAADAVSEITDRQPEGSAEQKILNGVSRSLLNRSHPDYGCKGRIEDTNIYEFACHALSFNSSLDTENESSHFPKALKLLEKSKAAGEIPDATYDEIKTKLDAIIKAVNEIYPLLEPLREAAFEASDNLGYEYSEN